MNSAVIKKLWREITDNTEPVDINNIIIDTDKSTDERINDFIFMVKNPYVFKVDDIIVTISFSGVDDSLEDVLCRLV